MRNPKKAVTLYHFTSTLHLPKILAAGFLETTENNVAKPRFVNGIDVNANRGPGVVWLTTQETVTPGKAFGLEGSAVDKTECRITVQVPKRDVHRWDKWATRRCIELAWLEQQKSVTPGFYSQRVMLRRIYTGEWTEVVNLRTGEVFDIPEAPHSADVTGGPGIRTVLRQY